MTSELTTPIETETEANRSNYIRWTNMIYRGLSILLDLYLTPAEEDLASGKVTPEEIKTMYNERFKNFYSHLSENQGKSIKPNWIIDEAFEEFYRRTREAYRKGDKIIGNQKNQIFGSEKEYARKVIRDLFNHRNLLDDIQPETKLALWLDPDNFDPKREYEMLALELLGIIKKEYPEAEIIQSVYPIGISPTSTGKVVYLIQENAETIDPKEIGEFRPSTFGTGSDEKRRIIKLANQFLYESKANQSPVQK